MNSTRKTNQIDGNEDRFSGYGDSLFKFALNKLLRSVSMVDALTECPIFPERCFYYLKRLFLSVKKMSNGEETCYRLGITRYPEIQYLD